MEQNSKAEHARRAEAQGVKTERWQVELSEAAGGRETLALFDQPKVAPRSGNELILLGHGAGTSAEHGIMQSLAHALVAQDFRVLRFNFAYRAPGADGSELRRPPDRMPKLVACMRAVLSEARRRLKPQRLILGGHSMGSRAAAHLAVQLPPRETPAGLLLCAYPLHPQGKPEKLRSEILGSIGERGLATLWISGTRDALCRPEVDHEVRTQLGPCFTHLRIPGVDHGYEPLKRSGQSRAEILREIALEARRWAGFIS